jgi:hypothetical protein
MRRHPSSTHAGQVTVTRTRHKRFVAAVNSQRTGTSVTTPMPADEPSTEALLHHFECAQEAVLRATPAWQTHYASRIDFEEDHETMYEVTLRAYLNDDNDRIFLLTEINRHTFVEINSMTGDDTTSDDLWTQLKFQGTRDEVFCRFADWLVAYGFIFRQWDLQPCAEWHVDFAVAGDGTVAVTDRGPLDIPPEVRRRTLARLRSQPLGGYSHRER